MQKVSFDAPAVYGDHHVLEVRRILLALPGVSEVYASSCFHIIEVSFDPAQVSEEQITSLLAAAGYLEPLPVLSEATLPAPSRHTAGYEQTRLAVSFAQKMVAQERPAWPCPGMGLLKSQEKKNA